MMNRAPGTILAAVLAGLFGMAQAGERPGAENSPPVGLAPWEAERLDHPGLDEPLLAEERGAAEKAGLRETLERWEADGQRREILERYLAAHPDSPWQTALRGNLGLRALEEGRYSQAIADLEAAWRAGKDSRQAGVRGMAERFGGELLRLRTRLGHRDAAQALLDEMAPRPLLGSASQALSFAREGLWQMRHPNGTTFQCGPLALAELSGQKPLPETESVPRTGGYDLAELGDLARSRGQDLTALYRPVGARVPVPSVVHWKSGHYAALLGEETRPAGRYYHVRDGALGRDAWVSEAALDDEASGYFLTEVSSLSADWRLASREEARGVVGAGVTSDFGGAGAGGPEGSCPAGGDAPGGVGGSGCNQGCIGGGAAAPMMQAATEAMIVSLSLFDTPLRYQPPKGPRVPFTLVYNQREQNQPASFGYGNVGPHWSYGGAAHVIDTPASPAANVKLYLSSGGARTLKTFDTARQSFAPDEADQSVLARVSTDPIVYERRLADGGKEIYRAALPQGTIRRVFLSQAVDPAGNALTYHYDDAGGQGLLRLTGFTDASGGISRLEYGHADPLKITALVDPFGRRATIAYDAEGRLESITDLLGIVSKVTYRGASGFIERLDTPYGATFFDYGESGMSRWLEITDARGRKERIETRHNAPGIAYSEASHQVPAGIRSFNVYLNSRNTFYWDGEAQARHPGDYGKAEIRHWFHDGSNTQWTASVLESLKRPLESRIWYNYPNQVSDHGSGNCSKPSAIARVLPDGRTQLTRLTYNPQGKPTSRIDPLGRETRYEYAANGIDLIAVRQKTASGFDTLAQITWNAQHRPLSIKDAAGRSAQFAYDGAGQLTRQTNALGQTTEYRYDPAGRLLTVINPLGRVEASYTYDAFGNLASETDAAGYRLRHAYDAANRRTRTIYPDGTTTDYTWDKLDLAGVEDRLGRRTAYQYDATRRLIAERDALRAIQYEYDAAGRLVRLSDGRGQVTTWERDLQGRVVAKETPDGARTSYEFDAAGRQIARADALGQRRLLAYGLDDRLTGIGYANTVHPTSGVGLTWDAHYPRLTALTDGAGTTRYTYKPAGAAGAGQLAAEVGPSRNATIQRSYDALGRLQSRTIGAEMETYGFDALGRLVSNKNSALGSFRYGYLGDTDQLTSVSLDGALLRREYRYGANRQDRRLAEIHHPLARGYRYDSAPEEIIEGIVEHDAGWERRWQYQYDAVGRLQKARRSDRQDFAYALDAADNLTAIHDPDGRRSYRHDAGNKIAQAPYRYDANGNRLEDEYRTYRWDAENRLVGIGYKAEPQRSTEFRYDGQGRRVAIVEQAGENRSETRYAWCDDAICQARDENDQPRAYYFEEGVFRPAPGTAASKRQGQREYFARDHLGSVRDVLDEAGKRLASYDYDPYGKQMDDSQTAPEQGYAGMRFHAPSGLYLTKYRAYDPETGRWLSRDPIGEEGGVNLYAYVGGNPLSYVDPEGLAEIPNPNGIVPGGPWTPAPGQPPDTYYGPKVPGRPQDVCRYVPENATGTPADPYWKYKEGGTRGWNRISLGGNPITPEKAHPGIKPITSLRAIPLWMQVWAVGIGLAIYPKPAY